MALIYDNSIFSLFHLLYVRGYLNTLFCVIVEQVGSYIIYFTLLMYLDCIHLLAIITLVYNSCL